MKKGVMLFSTLLTVVFAVSCGSYTEQKKSASGKPYEVFVVMDDQPWDGSPGDTLRSILQEPFPMLNTYEPHYSLLRTSSNKFNKLLLNFRNILIYKVDPSIELPSISADYDRWAEPQIVVSVTGPSDSVLMAYMDLYRPALQSIFDITEQDRFISRANRYVDPTIQEKALDHFGLKINIPKGYAVAVEQPDFMWVRYELPLISQGIVIYKYPLESRRTFTPEYQLEKRNEFVSRIPGPKEGSYMTTSEALTPILKQAEFNGRIWFESQGFWDVQGDFMGGPFTSYSTVNAATREVITIDTYVFSPKHDKRNYVRQLQSIAQTSTIPGDTVAAINFAELKE